MQLVASDAGIREDEAKKINDTLIRHFTSTEMAAKDIPENERQYFYTHICNSEEMNKQTYQAPLAVMEIVKKKTKEDQLSQARKSVMNDMRRLAQTYNFFKEEVKMDHPLLHLSKFADDKAEEANLADFSDNQWVTCFQESAELVLGKSADELGDLKDSNEAAYDQVFQDAMFKSYIFRLRAKIETYNDESRLKTICMNATPVDWAEQSRRLIEEIEKLQAS
ncbi:RFA1 [Mytilus edulis]|uniref:RFA1 n=1 Tax=Mytilus edulis TaxID=6550 RepID=A0A8S3UKA2_MYTED|nr:RFA1 [Mytilus edulis]